VGLYLGHRRRREAGAGAVERLSTALATLTLAAGLAAAVRTDLLRVTTARSRVALSGVLLALHWWCYFEAIKLAGAAVPNFTVYTAPILLAVVAPLVLPERRSRVALAAVLPGGAGLLVIALAGGGHARPLAIAIGLLGAVTYTVLVVMTKDLTARLNPLTIAFWDYAIANGRAHAVPADRCPHRAALGRAALGGAPRRRLHRSLRVRLRVPARSGHGAGDGHPVVHRAGVRRASDLGRSSVSRSAGGGLVVLAGAIVVLFERADIRPIEAPEL
jgi:uncharacterized membrane protein